MSKREVSYLIVALQTIQNPSNILKFAHISKKKQEEDDNESFWQYGK